MKKILFSITVFLTINPVFSQNFNFPDSNAVWSVYNEKYLVNGDSTHNFINYKRYYSTNDSIVSLGTFFALLREDTNTQQVFAIAGDSAQEHLLYDFSLGVNDTATVFPLSFDAYSGPINVIVGQVDSILLSGQYHKRLKVLGLDQNSNYDEFWIQGIGSTFGLFNSGITGILIFDIYYPSLLCFEKDGVLIYDNPIFSTCFENYPVGIKEYQLSNNIKIYPNPASRNLIIETDSKIHSYRLFSSLGKEFENMIISNGFHSMDVSNFPSGVYFISFKGEDGVLMKKLLIESGL